MTDLAAYATIAAAFFVIAVSPGPANIANAVVAMNHGRVASLRFSLGLTAGIGVWGLVAATGLGAVLQGSVYVLSALKVLGGLYLLWLAWQSGRRAAMPGAVPDIQISTGRWFWRGVILNLSNPKTVIAWMAALAVGLDAGATFASVFLGFAVCLAVALAVNIGYMLVFSRSAMMQAYARVRRWVDGVVAGLFAIAGLGLIRSALAKS
ncbi:MAG: LysE family translocator [Pseudomonadota bacterium]